MRHLWLIALCSAGCIGVSDPALVTVPLTVAKDGSFDFDGGPARDSGTPDAAVPALDGGARDGGLLPDGGMDPCASVTCPSAAHCIPETMQCMCNPGFMPDGPNCVPVMPGNPGDRDQAEVCTAWAAANTRRSPDDGFSVSSTMCDPGALSRDALDDALARLNFFRWFVGLSPTSDATSDNELAQACSVVSAWNPAGPAAHTPPSSAQCYTADGATGAGSSNIAWGAADAAAAIDLWMIDFGNETTFGHRRWLLNPPLSPVGIGHYRGGNNTSASCIRIFGGSGSGPTPNWLAFPAPGFVPMQLAQWHWTVHGNVPLNGTTATVVRQSDSMAMPIRFSVLSGSYGQAAAAIIRDGWNPQPGETYRVTVTGTGGAGTITYDVKPVTCM